MHYRILIGNAVQSLDLDGSLHPTVPVVHCVDAPALPGDMLNHQCNFRLPDGPSWEAFCQETGLVSLFFHTERWPLGEGAHAGGRRMLPEGDTLGRYARHGVVDLTNGDHALVQAARARYEFLHPQDVPNMRQWEHPTHSVTLAWLIWLDWWMGYALAHGTRPALDLSY